MKKGDFIYNEKIKEYEKKFDNINLTIEKEKIDVPSVLEYATYIIENYLENKQKMEEYLLNESLREYYSNDNSDIEIIYKLGKPTVNISNNDSCQFMWFDSKLDEHLITLEIVDKYEFSYITIDG